MAEEPTATETDTPAAPPAPADNTVKLDSKKFWERITSLRTVWENHRQLHTNKSGFKEIDAFLICCGSNDNELYKKNNIFHLWLFGFELLNTIIVITSSKIVICAREKTCRTLNQLMENKLADFELELVSKSKADGYQANYTTLEEAMSSSYEGRKIGFIEEPQRGKFVENFMARVKGTENQYTLVDYRPPLSDLLMLKDDDEQHTMRRAAEFTSQCMRHLQRRIEAIIDKQQPVTHVALSDELSNVLNNPQIVKSKLKKSFLELSFEPIIQSGGEYNLSYSAACTPEPLSYEYGTIVCMLGYRFREYCGNIARTLFIDASVEQRKNYEVLIRVYKQAILTLRHGTPLKDVWNAAVKMVRSKDPSLESHMLKNLGWGMGLEFGDKNYLINRKNNRVAQTGMIFNLQVGFQNLVDKKKKERKLGKAAEYSIIIADTVLVTEDRPEFLTRFKRTLIDYQIEDDEKDRDENGSADRPSQGSNGSPKKRKNRKNRERPAGGEPPPKRRKTSNESSANGSRGNSTGLDDSFIAANPNQRVTRNSNRRKAAEQAEQSKMRKAREKNQSALRERARRNLERLARETGGAIAMGGNEVTWEDPRAYGRVGDLPQLQANRVNVDMEQECVICPIMDHMVPFHVSTIKNVNVSSAGEYAFLRMNFLAPAAITSRGHQPKQPEVARLHPDSMFVKELSFRSKRAENLQQVSKQVKELQKRLKVRAKQSKEKPLVKQDKLKRMKDRNQIPILRELAIKPNTSGRKKDKGVIECHHNGFRLRDGKGTESHVLFSNIAHAFFQPAKGTPAVILHFRLKNRVMVGKKATEDFQVSKDVIDRSQEIGRSGYDYDGMREEQEERRRRVQMNKAFKVFVDKSEKIAEQNASELKFEVPEMKLGFNGVPSKSSVKIYPTTNCLVALEDNPPFVLATEDVEIAHFERVQFSLRNFDLVFVFKDFKKEVKAIASIPREHLDTLQDFLNWRNILFSQGKMNLDWKRIMGQIRQDLRGFIEHGGWSFLRDPEDIIPSDDDVDRPMSGSEYEPTDDDNYGSGSSDDYTSGEDGESYDDEDSGGGSGGDYDEEEDDGPDWEEQERMALEADRRQKQKERNRDFKDSMHQRAPKRRRRN